MKSILAFALNLFLLNCSNVEQISKIDQVNLVSSLETKLGLTNAIKSYKNGKRKEKKYKFTHYELLNNDYSNTISITFSSDTTLIKDSYKRFIILPILPRPYKGELELFSEFAYFENCRGSLPEEKCKVNLYSYYKNFYFHIHGSKAFIQEAIFNISEELIYTYKK